MTTSAERRVIAREIHRLLVNFGIPVPEQGQDRVSEYRGVRECGEHQADAVRDLLGVCDQLGHVVANLRDVLDGLLSSYGHENSSERTGQPLESAVDEPTLEAPADSVASSGTGGAVGSQGDVRCDRPYRHFPHPWATLTHQWHCDGSAK